LYYKRRINLFVIKREKNIKIISRYILLLYLCSQVTGLKLDNGRSIRTSSWIYPVGTRGKAVEA